MIDLFFNNIKEKRLARSKVHLLENPNSLLYAFKHSNTIFIHIPKTAGLSLVKAIYGDVIGGGHRRLAFYSHIFGSHSSQFFKFCIVRDPYDRLYSAYNYLRAGGMNIHDKTAYIKYLKRYVNFQDFVLNGLDKKIINEIIHFTPQSNFICDLNDVILVDYVGRFENLEDDIGYISKKMGKKITLPHLNKSKTNSDKFVYNDEMRKKVLDIYSRDFDILDYK